MLNKSIKSLKSSEFLKNVSVQVLTTIFAQIIPIISMPFLTRLYDEKEFAVYTTLLATAMVLQVATGGRYQFAIVLPKSDRNALDLFVLSVLLTLFYFVVSLLIIGSLIFSDIDLIQLPEVYFLVPFYVLFFGVWSSVTNYSIRIKQFKKIAISKILQSLVYVVSGIILGFLNVKAYGLMTARVGGMMSSSLYLWKSIIGNRIQIKFSELRKVAIEYIDYPKYGILPALMNTVAMQAIIFVLTHFFSKSDLGYFGLTNLIINAPLALIGQSFRDVFYQKIAYLINNKFYKKGYDFFKRSAFGLFIVGLPISLVLMFFGEEIFSFIFGDNWKRSGYFASILAFSFLIKVVSSPLSSVFNAIGRIKLVAVWQTTYFISTLSLMYLSIFIFELEIVTFLKLYVIHEVFLYSIYFVMQLNTLKKLC